MARSETTPEEFEESVLVSLSAMDLAADLVFLLVSGLIFAVKITMLGKYFQSLFSHCHVADFSNLKRSKNLILFFFPNFLKFLSFWEIAYRGRASLPCQTRSTIKDLWSDPRLGPIRFRATQISEVTKQ